MTYRFSLSAVLLAGVCSVMFCLAATELWQVDGDARIAQVVADGTGGCALIRLDTNNIPTIVWVDRFGRQIYQATVSNAVIISCSKKQLLYSDNLHSAEYVQVDTKGQVSRINAPQSRVQLPISSIYPPNVTADRKGFFGIKQNILSPVPSQVLVRFKNK